MSKNYPELLKNTARALGVQNVYDELLHHYPQFVRWSGSHNPMMHHYGEGGLVRHTWEIVEIGLSTIPMLNLEEKVDRVEFYLATLFHDTGKMFDYDEVTGHEAALGDPVGTTWKSSEHKRLIYHIPRSTLIWHDIIGEFPAANCKYHDVVLHDILAHHGRCEYGSPVAPKTHAAWLLHLCDSISARMDDADKLELVKWP